MRALQPGPLGPVLAPPLAPAPITARSAPAAGPGPCLRICSLNVNGFHASRARECAEHFAAYDVVIVTETHTVEPASLPRLGPGFDDPIACPARPARAGAVHDSGGVAIYARSVLGLRPWRAPRSHSVYARLAAGPGGRPLVLGAFYDPPDNSDHHCPLALPRLFEDAEAAALEGASVLLMGDFNARIGASSADVGDDDALLAALDRDATGDADGPRFPLRQSRDTARVTRRGEQLLELCHGSSMLILNGRAPGDKTGAVTSRGSAGDGASVVDYAIASRDLWSAVASLTVEDYGIQDHCALSLTLRWTSIPAPGPVARPPPRLSPSAHRRCYLWPRSKEELDAVRDSAARVLFESCSTLATACWKALPVAVHAASLQAALTAALDSQLRLRRPRRRPLPAPGAHHPRLPSHVRRLRDHLQLVSRQFRSCPPAHPAYGALRHAVCAARGAYRRELKAAQRKWRESAARRFLRLAVERPVVFWRQIHERTRTAPTVDPTAVEHHFTAVLNPVDPAANPAAALAPPDPVPGLDPNPAPALAALGEPFSDSEVTAGLKHLKRGKAPDALGLTAEALSLFLRSYGEEPGPKASALPALTALLNRFLAEGLPPDLGTSVLVPLYKGKGDPADLNNFRGISILPALAKLYAVLLERRLSRALDAAHARADSQFGFRKKRGTLEAAFVLRTLIDTRRNKVPLFVLFVDFRKAFDTVQRPLLWQVLRNLRLPDVFIRAVEGYYRTVHFRVELPTGLTAPIPAGVGVKQGCPLSPVLFGVFIESLLGEFLRGDQTPYASPTLGAGAVPPILYADDLANVSTSVVGLQRQCDRLADLAARYGLAINVAKTKAMAFGVGDGGRRAALDREPLTINEQPVAWVDEFRYLGLPVHAKTGFKAAPEALLAAATNRYHAMWRRCRELGIEDGLSLNTLFDSLVNSVLSYGAPIWAPSLFALAQEGQARPLADRVEQLQRRFQRAVLGLPQLTPSNLLALETGRPPLELLLFRSTVRFLFRLRAHGADSLLGRALAASLLWASEAGPPGADSKVWAGQLRRWAEALGCPSVVASLRSFLPRPRQDAQRAVTRGRAAEAVQAAEAAATVAALPSDPKEAAQAAYTAALAQWTTGLQAQLSSANGGSSVEQHGLGEIRAQRLCALRPVVPAPERWSRRLPALYLEFPTLARRSVVARSRFALPVHGLSIWSDPYDDGRARWTRTGPDAYRRRGRPPDGPGGPGARVPRSCPACPGLECHDPPSNADDEDPDPGTAPSVYTLEHALRCPLPSLSLLRSSLGIPTLAPAPDPDGTASDSTDSDSEPSYSTFASFLATPPTQWATFVLSTARYYQQLRAGDRRVRAPVLPRP